MSRRNQPAHIVALDDAIVTGLERLAEAEDALRKTLDEHIVAYATAKRAIDDAARVRTEIFYGIQSCRDAIKKLGYVEVVKVPEGLIVNLNADMEAARERAGL